MYSLSFRQSTAIIMGLQKIAVVQWLLQHPKEFATIVVEHATDDAIKSWRNRRAPDEGRRYLCRVCWSYSCP